MAGDDEGGEAGYAKLTGRRVTEAPSGAFMDEDIDSLITALPARLGRSGGECPTNERGESEGCFVGLGNVKSISRSHAIINWDFVEGGYKITCLSKNGMVVDKTHYGKDESVALKDESAIRIGPCNFYFQLPPEVLDQDDEGGQGREGNESSAMEMSDSERGGASSSPAPKQAAPQKEKKQRKSAGKNGTTYADIVLAAYNSEELKDKMEQGLTSSEICTWIFDRYPEWASPIEKRRQLQNGVQNVLTRKFTKQEAKSVQPGEKAPVRGCRWKYDPNKTTTTRKEGSTDKPAVAAAKTGTDTAAAAMDEESLGSGSADEDDYMEDEDDTGGAQAASSN